MGNGFVHGKYIISYSIDYMGNGFVHGKYIILTGLSLYL